MNKNKTFAERLFDGEIYAAEQFNPYSDKEYAKKATSVRDAEATFTASLPPDQRKAFEKLISDRALLASTENVCHFKHGFYLGAQLMIEILRNEV